MTAADLVKRIQETILLAPPEGITLEYVRGFFSRHHERLVAIIQKQYDALCRPGTYVPEVHRVIGIMYMEDAPASPLLFEAKDIGTSHEGELAVKARCHPHDPLVLREYAVCVKRKDETSWRILSGLEWAGSEHEALYELARKYLYSIRFVRMIKSLKNEGELIPDHIGPQNAPIVLQYSGAMDAYDQYRDELDLFDQPNDEAPMDKTETETQDEQVLRDGNSHSTRTTVAPSDPVSDIQPSGPTGPRSIQSTKKRPEPVFLPRLAPVILAKQGYDIPQLNPDRAAEAIAYYIQVKVDISFHSKPLLIDPEQGRLLYSYPAFTKAEQTLVKELLPGIEFLDDRQVVVFPLSTDYPGTSNTPGIRVGFEVAQELLPLLAYTHQQEPNITLNPFGQFMLKKLTPALMAKAGILNFVIEVEREGITPTPVDAFVDAWPEPDDADSPNPKAPPQASPPAPGLPPAPSAPESSHEPAPEGSEPTAWGGLEGGRIPDEQVKEGMRVVTPNGEHGVVTKVDVRRTEYTVTPLVFGRGGLTAQNTRTEVILNYTFEVKIDNGIVEHYTGALSYELVGPAQIPGPILDPFTNKEVPAYKYWDKLQQYYRNALANRESGNNARLSKRKEAYFEKAHIYDKGVREMFPLLSEWLAQWPGVMLKGFDHVLYRKMDLKLRRVLSPGYQAELNHLEKVPSDWKTRFMVGDTVVVVSGDFPHLRLSAKSIHQITGYMAVLEGGIQVPLYSLKHATSTLEPEPFTGDGWLAELAEVILVGDKQWLNDAACAAALKQYLTGKGLRVRVRVGSSTWTSSVDILKADETPWMAQERRLLNELLGISAGDKIVTIYPMRREGRAYDPRADYNDTAGGLWLKESVRRELLPLLAMTHKEKGISLSRNGEAWLAKLRSTGAVTPSKDSAETAAERTQTEGCFETSFEMPRFGTIRIVCGAQGRRDVWHNVFVGSTRYGYNGGRWAKGMVPPAEVLNEVRQRGITVFGDSSGVRESLLEPELRLDPVIEELIQNGGLRSELINDIQPELRREARSIPGLFVPDGKGWLEQARLHYEVEPNVKVVLTLPADHYRHSVFYETVDGFIELVHWALSATYVPFEDLCDDTFDDTEGVCAWQRQ